MKKLILCVAMVMMFFGVSYAKCFLIVNATTSEIISLSPENDAQLTNKDWQQIILTDDYRDVFKQLDPQPTYYKYQNNKFIKNIKKISDEQIVIQENEDKLAQKEKDKASAIEKIKTTASLTDSEVKALTE